jgi:hypothetical protein
VSGIRIQIGGLLAAVVLSALVCAGVTAASGSAAAPVQDVYVAPNGNDSAPGTLQRPWRTVRRGLAALRPGRRLVLRAGTYAERVEVARGGTASARAVIAAYPGERPVLAGRMKVIADHVLVTGLVIDGTGATAYDSALYVAAARGVEIAGCEIRNAVGSGVFVGDEGAPSRDVRLVRNWIHDNGKDDFHDHAIYWAHGAGGLIGNNVIERNAGFGIHLYPDADGVLVTQNTVTASGRSGVIVAGDKEAASDRNVIVNNISAFNGELGIRSSWDGPTGTGDVVQNNVLFGNTAGDRPTGTYAAGLDVRSNRIADPRFVNRSGRNYRLQPSSPARDRAVARYSLQRDFSGRKRPRGSGPDIGAYER